MPTLADIKKRLHLTAELVAIRHGFRFSSDCESHLLAFIDAGIAELVSKNMTNEEIQLRLAEAGITALVEKMVESAIAGNLKELQESTFFSARNFLCPLFPFCL